MVLAVINAANVKLYYLLSSHANLNLGRQAIIIQKKKNNNNAMNAQFKQIPVDVRVQHTFN